MKSDLVSIADLSDQQIEAYLQLASKIESTPDRDKGQLLVGKLLMVLFFEPSTRTRLSFEAAMKKLGGAVAGFSETAATSMAKGESFLDTIKTTEQYGDALVIRHPQEGAARLAAERSRLPVINAGDGANQHPSQTLLDLFTIQKLFRRLDHLKIALVGDLRYSRTVYSLLHALRRREGNQFLLVSPPILKLAPHIQVVAPGESVTFRETTDLNEAVRECDIIYMTRIQKERFGDLVEYESVKDAYVLDAAMLKQGQEQLRVLHPLPRVTEISPDVDDTRFASYFDQARNGLIVRQAILLRLLGGVL
ncbi:MAG: aspartate carbamoyltransferase [Deltaproteobacteria bacterium]|nr:aspartate carbamoyltransferase [Deltaproteobacteria bacterium]